MTETDEMTQPEEHDAAEAPAPEHDPDEEEAAERLPTEEETAAEPVEAEAQQGVSQQEWEDRHKRAEKEFRRYTNSVGRIYEEDALAYLPCPLCADAPAGFVHPASAGTYPDDVTGAVMMLLGQTDQENVRADPYSSVCLTCVGWGVVRTGSHVPNQETRTCLDCKGLGYQPLDIIGTPSTGTNGSSEQDERGIYVPAQTSPESPEIEALRLRGYTIVPPMSSGG
jgi:hypothetical protein